MATIAVLTPKPVPWVEGGNERHWRAVTAALQDAGHTAELIGIDAPESTLADVLASYRRFVELDLTAFDVVISGKYPSHMTRHPRHIRHLTHTLRGLYDTYPRHLGLDVEPEVQAALSTRSDDAIAVLDWAQALVADAPEHPRTAFPGPFARLVVQTLDRIGRDGLRFEATLSERVAEREGYCDPLRPISVIPAFSDLHRPAVDDVATQPRANDDRSSATPFFFSFGRMDHVKRFDLIVEAFASATSGAIVAPAPRLVLAGTGPDEARIRALAERVPNVDLVGRLSDDDLDATIAAARAVILTPLDEDYGLVAAESMARGTPVIASSDSGGLAEQIEHDVTGLIAPPSPDAIGQAIARLAAEPDTAARMGRAASEVVSHISPVPLVHLVERALETDARPRVVLLSTFSAERVFHGGQARLRRLASGLEHHGFDPVILSLSNEVGPERAIRRRRTHDLVEHVTVPRSRAHLRADFEMSSLVGVPVDDIGCHELWPSTPPFADEVQSQLDQAAAVIVSQPYLITSLPHPSDVPIVYDAYNVEEDLKAEMLGDRPGKDWLLERVRSAERTALERASLLTVVSSEDQVGFDRKRAGSPVTSVIVPSPLDPSLLRLRDDDERRRARARFFADLGRPDDGRRLVIFIGSDHPPNREAIPVLQALAASRGDLTVIVAGSVQMPGAASPNLIVVGPVPGRDLRRLLAMSDAFANPIRSGGGTSLKILDPLSVGVPVVSTPIGARGLSDAEELVVLSDIDHFGSALDDLWRDEARTRSRVDAGHRWASSWRAEDVVAPLAAWLRRSLES